MTKPERYAVWTSMYEDDASAISLNKIAYYCVKDQDILKGNPEKDRVAFVFCSKGKLRFEQDEKNIVIRNSEVLCSYISSEYTVSPSGSNAEYIVLITSGKLAREMMEHRLKDFGNVTGFGPKTLLLCEEIYDIAKTGWSYENEIRISCLLYNICGELMIQHSRDPLLEPAVRHLHEHYMENISMSELCKISFLGSTRFIRRFKDVYGMTPKAYLTTVRISKAKTLLITTDMQVSCISGMVGYEDASYFARTFKRCEGITPNEYRAMHKY